MNTPARPATGSIEEGLFVEINALEQWITIRGADRRNPVLLVVGGSGVALSRLALFFAPWEKDFTLVHWDQPGAGGTESKNGAARTGTLTLDRIARDGLAVAQFVRDRLGVPTVVLLGFSAGSAVALKMITQRPELFSAYVGTGQIVHWARQDMLSYHLLLTDAQARGDAAAVKELTEIGAPPYRDVARDVTKSKYAAAFTPAEHHVFTTLDPAARAAMQTPPTGANYVPTGLPLLDQRAQAVVVYAKLRDEFLAFDARPLGLRIAVPVFFFQGALDVYTVNSEVERYVADLHAPRKIFVTIEGGGHSAMFLRDDFLRLLNRLVRPVVTS